LDISRHYAASDATDRRIEADFEPEGGETLPKRLYQTLKRKFGDMTLKAGIRRCDLGVNGVYGYKKAEATAGGVELKEVEIGTMASKLVPGLYFAGEILDIDGRIGGFNFQWAWSTGVIAGRAVVKGLK
jgi:predicted flavoprotein YhiN